MPTDPPSPRYTHDEMSEILKRALARQTRGGDIAHDELIDAAREVGIDVASVEEAAAEVAREKSGQIEPVNARQLRRRRAFRSHLTAYLLVNAFLFVLNLMVPGPFWFQWALLGWGLGLAFHAVSTFSPHTELPEERARRLEHEHRSSEKRARREARRLEAQTRHERKERVKESAQEFERAVENGVASLLQSIARKIDPVQPLEGRLTPPKRGAGVRIESDAERSTGHGDEAAELAREEVLGAQRRKR